MPKVWRPAMRYHGGKWRLAPWIIGHFPKHRVYVEPFGGAASVLLRKARSYAEVYNDLDGEVVNIFRVLRCPELSQRLIEAVRLTPFSREEFNAAYHPCEDSVERARRTLVKSYMGFGSAAVTQASPTLPGAGFKATTGFRANSNRSGTTAAHDWANYPPHLATIVERLRGVVIENLDYKDVLRAHDSPHTLVYADPPYVHSTRGLKRWRTPQSYRHEMSDNDHAALLDVLDSLSGMVVLSGYPSELYRERLRDWSMITSEAHADGARKRVEVLWLNRRATEHGGAPLLEVA